MKNIIGITLLVLTLSACETQDKNSELEGKWQAVAMEAPQVERAMQDQMNFLDTMGDHTTAEQNLEIYGAADVTQLKDSLKGLLEEYLTVQDEALKHTVFEFRADSTFIRTLNSNTDTGKWHVNEAGKLVISDVKEHMQQVEIKMLSLTDTSLKLQMQEDGMASTVIFKHIDNN